MELRVSKFATLLETRIVKREVFGNALYIIHSLHNVAINHIHKEMHVIKLQTLHMNYNLLQVSTPSHRSQRIPNTMDYKDQDISVRCTMPIAVSSRLICWLVLVLVLVLGLLSL